MGHIFHWVTRLNPTDLIKAAVYAAGFVIGMGVLADALGTKNPVNVNLMIDNKGDVQGFKVEDGKLVPIKIAPRK